MMSPFIKHAFKNIFRNKRRTFITLFIITFGIVSLFVTYGFIDYSFEGIRESTIRQGLGHIQVFHKDYLEKQEERALQYGIENAEDLIKEITLDEDVRFAMKHIDFQGLISSGDKSEIFLGRGIEPRLQEKLSSVFLQMNDGRGLSQAEGSGDYSIILGKKLAKNLNVKIGDYVTVLSATTYGAQNAMDFKLTGTFSTGVPQMDERLVMVDVTAAQVLLDTKKVSKIITVLNESEQTAAVYNRFLTAFSDNEIRDWESLAPFYKAVVRLYNSGFGLLGFIILFIVILAVSNTTVMSITERTQEIGTFLAIGTPRQRILKNFFWEGLSIGILASLIGVVMAVAIILTINFSGIQMPPPPGSTEGYPLHVNLVPSIWINVCGAMILVSIVSSIVPAYNASKMNIIGALNHV